MEITGILSAIIVGIVVGALGRLVVPGRQPMGLLMTFLLGLVGAFIGGFIGAAISSSWVVILLCQVAIAALLVFLVAGAGASTRRRSRIF
jgi:uncharacterized membrane protein YeaQ/YmgE (transglycosylase-associated protein family)